MNTIFTRLVGKRRRTFVCMLLAAASAICGALVIARFIGTDTWRYFFLLWNLFLAWVPFGAALLVYELHRRGERGAVLLATGLVWLLFFPNAPYIVSDLVHLQKHGVTPERFIFWYDLIMVSCFAWTGMLLGFVSLYLMQTVVRKRFGGPISWGFVGVTIGLAGFGVYLGRFQRWNSWDLLHRPVDLVSDIALRILHPFDHTHTWGITVLFATMMMLLYVLLYGFMAIAGEGKGGRSAATMKSFHIT